MNFEAVTAVVDGQLREAHSSAGGPAGRVRSVSKGALQDTEHRGKIAGVSPTASGFLGHHRTAPGRAWAAAATKPLAGADSCVGQATSSRFIQKCIATVLLTENSCAPLDTRIQRIHSDAQCTYAALQYCSTVLD